MTAPRPAVPLWRRALALALCASLAWASLPPAALAISEARASPRKGGRVQAPTPIGRVPLIMAVQAQLSQAPNIGADGVLRQARLTVDSPHAAPTQKAAARAILGAATKPGVLQQLESELARTVPASAKESAKALKELGSGSAEALSTAVAGIEKGLPDTLDQLYETASPAPRADAAEPAAVLNRVERFYKSPLLAPSLPVTPAPGANTPPEGTGDGSLPLAEPPIKVSFGNMFERWLDMKTWLARVLSLGHYGAFHRRMAALVNRLAIPGDNPNYTVRLRPNVDPNAMIDPDRAYMMVHLGLLSYTADEDELASIIAHEMTHANKEQLKALADDADVKQLLESLEGYKDLDADQREEMRADIGALDRLVKAGYNPWGAYRVEKKFAKIHAKMADMKLIRFLFKWVYGSSFDYMEAHPVAEIRMAAVKAYIMRRGYKEDMSQVTQRENPLPFSLRLLRWRTAPLTWLMMLPLLWYYLGAQLVYSLVVQVISFFSPTAAETVKAATKDGLDSAGGFFGELWTGAKTHVFAPINDYVLAPIWNHALGPVWSVIAEAAAWLWVKAWIPWDTLFPSVSHKDAMGGLLLFGLVSLLPLTVYMAILEGFRADAQYKRLAKAKSDRTRTLFLFESRLAAGTLDDADLAGMLDRARRRLDDVQTVYLKGGLIASLRRLSGLSLARYRWLGLYERLLAEAARRLEAAPAGERWKKPLAKDPLWQGLPAIAVEHDDARRGLERMVSISGAALGAGHPLALFRQARALEAGGEPAQVLDLLPSLLKAGMNDTARRLHDARQRETLLFALSPAASRTGKDYAQIWLDAEKTARARATLLKRAYRHRLWRETRLLWLRLRSIGKPLEDRLTLASFLELVPKASWRFLSLRGWLGKLDLWLLSRRLAASVSTVRELKAFVEEKLAPRQAPLEQLSPMLHGLILSHPRWVAGPEDLEALLSADAFWPRFGKRPAGFLEQMLADAVKTFSKKYPAQWKYEPASSERLHALYLSKLKEFALEPKDFDGRVALWKSLTARGITSSTDATFAALYDEAPRQRKAALEDLALAGHIWDQPTKAAIVEKRLKSSPRYQALLSREPGRKRLKDLGLVIQQLKDSYAERGIHYARILESLSLELRSTPAESAVIHRAKIPSEGGEKAEDFSLRFLSYMMGEALGWSKSQQWELVKFLRGDAPPSRKVRRAFRTIGPERVKRFYDLLPLAARVGLLDHFLDSPRGLVHTVDLKRGYAALIIDHILPQGDREARRTAHEVLEAFLYSLDKTGNTAFQSYVLSYILALPKDEVASIGKTLRGILEIFGASGVKIGQFLAASQLLPEAETKELRQLQERALVPQREDVYADLREITGRRDMPFRVLDLLGAASIKYAALGVDEETSDPVVLKVFRLSAVAHTNQEFLQLDHMADYLRRNYGGRYGVFRAIVKAAKKAVERELSSDNEVARSRVAREEIYAGKSGAEAQVTAPREALLHKRLIASEYAPGVSLFDLAPAHRGPAAREILKLEGGIYFADSGTISFDPDRHPGNYRILVREGPGGLAIRISPIDQGQGLTITSAERERILELFALAQILAETGSTAWAAEELQRLLSLDAAQARRLKRALRDYFPDAGMRPVAAHYSLLAAMDDAALDPPISYFDFVRGIVQFSQYEEFAPDFSPTPRRRLEAETQARGARLAASLAMGPLEKARVARHRLWRGLQESRLVKAAADFARLRPVRRLARAAAVALLVLAASAPFQSELRSGAESAWSAATEIVATTRWPWLSRAEKLSRELKALAPGEARQSLSRMLTHWEGVPQERRAAAVQVLVDGANAGQWPPDDALLDDVRAGLAAATDEARGDMLLALARLEPGSIEDPATRRLAGMLSGWLTHDSVLVRETLTRRLAELALAGKANSHAALRAVDTAGARVEHGTGLQKDLLALRIRLLAWREKRLLDTAPRRNELLAAVRSTDFPPEARRAALAELVRMLRLGDLHEWDFVYEFRRSVASLSPESRLATLQALTAAADDLHGEAERAYALAGEIIRLEDADSLLRLEAARLAAAVAPRAGSYTTGREEVEAALRRTTEPAVRAELEALLDRIRARYDGGM